MLKEIEQFRHHFSEYGNLVFVESQIDVPFQIRRVYYIYEVPKGVSRGFHAHKKLEQYLICVHGKCVITLDDGFGNKKSIELNDPSKGLYVGHGMWRIMHDFSEDAVLMVLASELYDESDYIRDYDSFLKYKGRQK